MKPNADAQALYAIVRDLMNTKDGATYFAGRVWGISTNYDLGGSHPLIGYSVPNFEFEDGTTIGELMQDGKGIMLDFNMNDSLKTLASDYSNEVKYISARAKEQLGLRAALIRPDGIIAFASDDGVDERAFQKAADRWFVCD